MIRKFIRLFFRKTTFVPDYEEKRNIILSYKRNYNASILVETGTFMGDTVQALLNEFKLLYSIELSSKLADRARKRFSKSAHVSIITGSSDVELIKVVEKLREPAIFWLDGHYSGEFMYEGEFVKTARGSLNTPVLRELEVILEAELPHIILIDDARLFTGNNEYPTVNKIKEMIQNSKLKRVLSNKRDIIRIVPEPA
jgi:hypothetical protein